MRIFEGIGHQLQALDVSEQVQFDGASALLNYILGLAGQHAAGARLLPPTRIGRRSSRRSPHGGPSSIPTYPFVHRLATQLPDHDDREQFLAGIDLILAGIDTVR